MKHAYLIIAHHEFKILQVLIDLLDDLRNDIYIHFDKKLKDIPLLRCKYAELTILQNRVDVRWGHISQVESEYLLFESAYGSGKGYRRFHLISGTHLPLKTQNEIHRFFDKHPDKEIISPLHTDHYEIDLKLGRYHFFLKNYKHANRKISNLSQFFWHVFLKIQYKLNIKRGTTCAIKASNWVSLTAPALAYILDKKKEVLSVFKYSFCGDEFFVPYALENADNSFQIMSYPHLLFNDFEKDSPRLLDTEDYEFLIQSNYLFARKFSEKRYTVVEQIYTHLSKYLNLTR